MAGGPAAHEGEGCASKPTGFPRAQTYKQAQTNMSTSKQNKSLSNPEAREGGLAPWRSGEGNVYLSSLPPCSEPQWREALPTGPGLLQGTEVGLVGSPGRPTPASHTFRSLVMHHLDSAAFDPRDGYGDGGNNWA
jgi:hypothetical protein